jgi:tetratricopeptide (TPR) repeat protein
VLARTGTFFDAVNKGMQGAAAGQDGSVTLPDLERYVKQQFASSAFQPVLLSNTTGLFTILTHSLGADDMEQIQKLIRGDRYEEALTIVNSRLATDPDDGTALAQKARLISYQAEQFRRYSRMHEALEAAEKAVRLAPNEALPYVARANVFRIQKKYEKSFADATAAVRCDPNCVMAHVIRGFALHHLHDLEGMGREAKLGMDIAPEHPEARATYVAYLFAKGRLDEGHSQLDRAIAITPDMPALYFLKGYGFEKQGKHLAAVAQYDQAITLNNQIPSYLCRRAISHSNSGNHNAAMADVAAAEAVDPEYFDIASVRAMVIQKQRGYGQSEQAIADGLKKNPKSADLWYGRGFNFLNSGRYAEAIKSFEQALEINPGYGEVHMGIGMVYAKQNRWDDALVHLNRATRHKEHLTRAYFEKCQVYIGKRDYASALRELDKAMGYEPRNSVFVQQRQQLLMMQGR